jgi:hypothetical protein
MNPKVRALVWEECRTGGLIAATATAVGAVLLLQCRWAFGSEAWTRDSTFAGFVVLGIPVMAALLLILNPDYSGHLVGGFSRRVLRLPVPTPAAVAVALASRAVFVFATTLIPVTLSMAFFDGSPGIEMVFAITLFYLLAQALDWLRGPLSGLSSLLALGVISALIERMLPGASNFTPMKWALDMSSQSPALWPLAIVAAAALAYAVSVVAVTADRVGRRYGIPEIWEWPRRVSFTSSRRRAPFRSALSAQVWFEVRRSAGVLPVGTLVLCIILFGGFWIYRAASNEHIDQGTRLVASFLLLPALLFAAGAHGVRTRVLGFRSSSGKAGYELLQPLTSAQFAQARVLANLVLLVPTLAAALALHFALAGQMLVTEWIPEGLRLGATSAREVAWMLLSRGMLAGISAWALLAIGTRVFRRAIGVTFVLLVVAAFVAWLADKNPQTGFLSRNENAVIATLDTILVLVPIALTLALFWFARSQELISARGLAAWAGVWTLIAWLFRYAAIPAWLEEGIPLWYQLAAIVTALGWTSAVPLAYVAVLLDLRRKRHGDARPQDPAQHAPRRMRPVTAVAAVVAVVFVLWLGWPAKPAYLDFRKSKGYPATLAELEAAYPEPPPNENFAPEFERIARENEALAAAYWKLIKTEAVGKINALNYDGDLLIAGGAELTRAEPIGKNVWAATDVYWNEITSHVAPQLREFAGRDTSKGRYPIVLQDGYSVLLPHLARLRSLDRELALDALHWAVASRPDQATDSILAAFPLADSLIDEPVVTSQLVRMALLSITANSIRTVLNRSMPSEADLVRLQRACEDALPDPAAMDRAMIGESTLQLGMAGSYPNIEPFKHREALNPYSLASRLTYPIAAQQMMMSMQLESLLAARHLPWSELLESSKDRDTSDFYTQAAFVLPYIWMGSFVNERTYESVWRTRVQLDTARVGIAVERFRLAHGTLPRNLNELTPAFLSAVPEDYFAGPGAPLRYRVRDNGEYVVYSIGRNGKDDLGEEMKRWNHEGDITFTVAPQSVRSGPQIASE